MNAPRITGLIRKRPLDSPAMENFHGRGEYPMRMLIDNDEYEYDTCDWCGWWGGYAGPMVPARFMIVESDKNGKLLGLCLRCIKLDEPPWKPNNRDRCDMWLQQVFRQSRMAKLDQPTQRLIAEMLADNDP